jgi:dGTPase
MNMALMSWDKLLSPQRLGRDDNSKNEELGRTSFHKDYDRITFSASFRRLGKKTQVHPLAKNDHIHSRLTHSIEVSSVGRSLGILVGEKIKKKLPPGIDPMHIGQILQAASLAHDLGNPPFGHAGEEAIKAWFSNHNAAPILEGLSEQQQDDFRNFEGNAQGFRIITQLEHNHGKGGMQLTYATLATMLKYPWTSREIKKIKKFCSFQSEVDILDKVAFQVGLIQKDESHYCRHPLAFLTEAADDICYRILDLEDAHEMKLLNFVEVKDILDKLCDKDDRYEEIISSSNYSNRRKLAFLRSKAIGKSVNAIADVFEQNYEFIMQGTFNSDIELISKCHVDVRNALDEAKRLARDKVFNEPRKIELEIGCYTAIGILLDAFCRAVRERVITNEKVSYKSERVLSMMGINAPKAGDKLYESYLKVTDYISGMTDNYASYMARQIGGMGT